MIWTTRQRSKTGGIAAIVAGDGPTVMMLHGVGLRAEAWNAQIDALSSRFRVIAPDMPGHGESMEVTASMRLQGYTDALAELLDDPALVIGHSMGAMIALDMAVRYPQKLRGVAALNAIYKRTAEATAAVRARAESLDGYTVADPEGTLRRWFGEDQSPERSACAEWLKEVSPAGYKAAYNVFANSNGPEEAALAGLACPALFMTGRNEPNSTPQMSLSMAGIAPQGRAIIVEDAAHMMPMTHPAAVNTALLAFAGEVWS